MSLLVHNEVEIGQPIRSLLETATFYCGHFYQEYYVTLDSMHVILDTRPSRFSHATLKKLGVAWGRGYVYM